MTYRFFEIDFVSVLKRPSGLLFKWRIYFKEFNLTCSDEVYNLLTIEETRNFNLNFNVAYFTSGYVEQIISPEYEYRDCEWYEFMCHIGNGVAYVTFNVPVLENFYSLFNNFKIMLSQTIDLFIEYKEITFFGSIVIAGIALHFIKRSVE